MKHLTLLLSLTFILTSCNPTPSGYGDLYGSAQLVKELHYYASEKEGVIDFDVNRFYKRVETHFDKNGNPSHIIENYGNQTQIERNLKYDASHKMTEQHTQLNTPNETLEMWEELIEKQDNHYTLVRYDKNQSALQDTLTYQYEGSEEFIAVNGNQFQHTKWNEFHQPLRIDHYNEQGHLELTIEYTYQLKTLLTEAHTYPLSDDTRQTVFKYEYMELDKYGNWTQATQYVNDSLTYMIFRDITY